MSSGDTSICDCGCGLPAPVAARTDRRRGQVKGQALPFRRGHHLRPIPSSVCPKCDKPKAPGQSYCSDHMREAMRASYQRHADKRRGEVAQWRLNNPEKTRVHQDAWREGWRARNPERAKQSDRERCATRRARLSNVFVERIDPQLVYDRDTGVCQICGDVVARAEFEVDHIVPIARGGPHAYNNVQTAHPVCNRRKSTK